MAHGFGHKLLQGVINRRPSRFSTTFDKFRGEQNIYGGGSNFRPFFGSISSEIKRPSVGRGHERSHIVLDPPRVAHFQEMLRACAHFGPALC